jgi:hypothetical protein
MLGLLGIFLGGPIISLGPFDLCQMGQGSSLPDRVPNVKRQREGAIEVRQRSVSIMYVDEIPCP